MAVDDVVLVLTNQSISVDVLANDKSTRRPKLKEVISLSDLSSGSASISLDGQSISGDNEPVLLITYRMVMEV